MGLGTYILEEDGTIKKVDTETWSKWFEKAERHVGNDFLDNDVHVSTVFLGLDQNFSDEGPPLLFETMIFGGPNDQYQDRYATKEEALEGHAKAVKLASKKRDISFGED
jgi:hypothetical protein